MMPFAIALAIQNLPPEIRDERTPALLDQLEAAAREHNDWGGLGLAYLRLTRDAHRRSDQVQVDRYAARLFEVLREHPVFQNPRQGNTYAVQPSDLAQLMIEVGRREQLETFLREQDEPVRAELAIGLVGALAGRGDFDAAAGTIDDDLRPIRPDIADRLTAALRGEIVLPPATQPTKRNRDAIPAGELRLRTAQEGIATGHAVRGDVDTAGNMNITLQRDRNYHPVGKDRLVAYEWSRLAMYAIQHGHIEAGKRGFEHALESARHDRSKEADDIKEEARLVREAVAIGDYDVAHEMLNTTRRHGAWARLSIAQTYRAKGHLQQAKAMLDEAITQAYQVDAQEGATMAEIAVELLASGEPARAEQVLLDALPRIEGVDFGISGSAAVVEAAAAMDRLDLLDKIYETSDTSYKLMLCAQATRLALQDGSGKE